MININSIIIAYRSVNQLSQLTVSFSALIAVGLSFRCTIIFLKCIDEEMSYKEAFISCKKRFIGAVIAITITGLIAYFKRFF